MNRSSRALVWGMDWTDPCSPNPMIALASYGALALGGLLFLAGMGIWMTLDWVKRVRRD